MKKSVALGIAGLAAIVVATWRQVQRESGAVSGGDFAEDLPGTTDFQRDGGRAPKPDAGKAEAGKSEAGKSEAGKPDAPASPEALFTPSIGEKSTKAELYKVAGDLEIEGRSKMNKAQLLEAIRTAS
ncbi:MAG: Rho termination factor N-terminal domain-containing protein [Solirubrobacterales bacterium]|nr:Rho termination factor N-terminal domain-containing protein [Solirubrobacterales bacterium]